MKQFRVPTLGDQVFDFIDDDDLTWDEMEWLEGFTGLTITEALQDARKSKTARVIRGRFLASIKRVIPDIAVEQFAGIGDLAWIEAEPAPKAPARRSPKPVSST